jgi:hypothetical protein
VALAWAQDPYSNAAVGQFIYIEKDETAEDGKTYVKGPYVVDVIGENAVLTPLSKGSAGNAQITDVVAGIQSDVKTLQSDVDAVEADVADALAAIGTKGADGVASTGLYAEIDNVIKSLDEIEVPVEDVQVNGAYVVVDGVASIDMNIILDPYAKTSDISATYATKDSLNDYALKSDSYTKTEVDGVAAAAAADAINALNVTDTAVAGKYVASVSEVNGKVVVTREDLPTVEVPVYSIAKADKAEGDNAHTYYLTKDGDKVGASINIPKDMMVQEGSVVTLADGEVEGYAAGTYIKLVLANSDSAPLYIAATDLIDVYISGNKYITVAGYTITFEYDSLVADLKTSLASTFDAAGTAEGLVNDAVSAINTNLADYAKTADVNATLADYAKTADVNKTLEDYAKTADVNASIKEVSDKNKAQDDRLSALEDLVTGGSGEGGDEDQTLVQRVNANKIAIAALESTVGKAAEGENPATGLIATTIDLTDRVLDLENNSIKSIVINGVAAEVADNTATISLVNSLSDLSDDDAKKAVSAGAVSDVVIDLTNNINGKASISLVDAVPVEGDTTVIYLEKVDNKITEKIYLSDGSYHVIGSDLYASKDLATSELAGLMSAADKVKLDSIETITSTELDNIFNKVSE